jgi:hypothetical protein
MAYGLIKWARAIAGEYLTVKLIPRMDGLGTYEN